MVSQQNAILRKAANKRGKKGGPKKRKQLSDDSDVGSSDSEGAVKGDAAGKLGKKKATPKKKKAKAVSGDNENGLGSSSPLLSRRPLTRTCLQEVMGD
jgi:hypothetical protein